MALLFIDGFETYTTSDMGLKWEQQGYSGAPYSIVAGVGRRGGSAVKPGYPSWVPAWSLGKNLQAATSTLIVGYATLSPTIGNGPLMAVRDSSSSHCVIRSNSDGSISAYREQLGDVLAVLLGTSAPSLLKPGVYQFLEFKAIISATSGRIMARVNGVVVLDLTGINTKGGSSSSELIGAFSISPATSTSSDVAYIDDVYVCDATGSVNNDFLGDVRIDALYPTADGTYSGMTPSTGTAHWSLVDDTTPNTTDYVSSSTAGAKDSYGFSDLAASAAAVIGLQISHYSQKSDAGARSAASLVRSGATNAQGATVALGTNYQYFTSISTLDPATGAAWTQTAINAAEFGVVTV